jgi:hypothetical protein
LQVLPDVLTAALAKHNRVTSHRKRNGKEIKMSNSPDQDQLIEQTPTQRNPGAAKARDFKIEDRDGGQHGDTQAERAALLAEANSGAKASLPDRNEVPQGAESTWVNK